MTPIPTELDSDQRAVVDAPAIPLLVVAGAGSGKTRTLINRIGRFIELGIEPSRILMLTFTQRAAHDMSTRLARRYGDHINVWAGTFHSIAVRLLRPIAEYLGYGSDFSILDRSSSRRLFDKVVDSWIRGGNTLTISSEALQRIYSLSINSGRELLEVMAEQKIESNNSLVQLNDLLTEYLVSKLDNNVMDYDDLLTYWQLALHDDRLSAGFRNQFDAVLIDEYQDVNPIQADIVDQMVKDHGNLTAVGDDFQSIYAFRGANVDAMMSFTHRYPEAQILPLRYNYRSTPEIVAMASASISHNKYQHQKEMVSQRGSGPKPRFVSVDDTQEEARCVARRIQELHEYGVPYDEQAVLYRTHSQSKEIQLALKMANIPFLVQSTSQFFDRPHIRPIVALLRVVAQPKDMASWSTVLAGFDGVGPVGADAFLSILETQDNPWDALDHDSVFQGLSPRVRTPLKRASRTLAQFHAYAEKGVSSQLVFIIQSEYTERFLIDHKEPEQVVADYESLIRWAEDVRSLPAMLDTLVLDPNTVGHEQPESRVTLSTVHQSKGLEWAAVFILGLSEGKFPLWSALSTGEALEEERRLFYVALTRASRFVDLYHSWGDTQSVNRGTLMPSRFITELAGGRSSSLLEYDHEL